MAVGALALTCANEAQAQRSTENATTAAQDVFGTSVGNESIGIYNSGDVRGFSPVQAGNVRIDGLYFDMVGDQNDRIEASSAIRVGIAAQGYAFPAPSGIVDYALRVPGEARALSLFEDANSWWANTTQLDGTLPVGETLSVGGGVGYYRNEFSSGATDYEGNFGLLARWHPLANLEILPFWSRKQTFQHKHSTRYAPNGDFLPTPMPGRHFFGPPWALSTDYSVTYGGLMRYDLSSWTVRLGLFRSEKANPTNNQPVLDNLATDGTGELVVESSPPSHLGSTSGEFRLEKSFAGGPWVQRLLFSLRGRNWNGLYGRSINLDQEPRAINQWTVTPKPQFQYGPLTRDHVDERWLGFEYQVAWNRRLQLSLGAEKVRYHKRTLRPGAAPAVVDAAPWLLTGSATANVTDKIALFGDYTQGLEENGIAPGDAANSNQALPAVMAHQAEGGLRWTVLPAVNFVTTLFEIKKPYFDLDRANVFRELGGLENKGLELSLSGKVTPRLDIIAGGVLSQPTVVGEAVQLGDSGGRPVGIYSRKFLVGGNWRPPGTRNLSFDLDYHYFGGAPASLNDAVRVPAYQTMDWDTRYQFEMGGQSASLKLAVFNMFNVRGFKTVDAGTYTFFGPSGRTIDLRLIVDVS